MMELHFLKTTWSDIIILKEDNNVAMIDTGTKEQFVEIKKYLDEMGIKKISFIILTHFHKDHYGSLVDLVKNFDVETVYFKNYSGVDKTTSLGEKANNDYRLEEYNKSIKIKQIIRENSKLVEVENLKEIEFCKYKLKLFNNSNIMKEMYENEKSIGYHRFLFNENQNSMAIFFNVNGINVFLGGDISDSKSLYSEANYLNYNIANKIKQEIDIYKVPHHGTSNCNSKKTLDIYKPKVAIITNGEEYLKNESSIFNDLKRANKNVKILLTENHNIIINIFKNGKIAYKEF